MANERDARFNWLHFTMRAGDIGYTWAQEYKSQCHVMERSGLVLRLTRNREYDEAANQLQAFSRDLLAGNFPDPSKRYVLERFYYGAAAYLNFCTGDLPAARCTLLKADRAVVNALHHAPVLIMLAVHCHEFEFHLARIAREQKDWHAMRYHLLLAQEMFCGSIPLCAVKGRAISMSDVNDFLSRIEPLSIEEEKFLSVLGNSNERLLACERMTRQVERLPYMAAYYA